MKVTLSDGSNTDFNFVVGSDTIDTNVLLSSNTNIGAACEQNFVVYAPRAVRRDSSLPRNSTQSICPGAGGRYRQGTAQCAWHRHDIFKGVIALDDVADSNGYLGRFRCQHGIGTGGHVVSVEHREIGKSNPCAYI